MSGGAIDGLPAEGAPVTTDEWNQLCLVMNGYIYSQTLATACELDLFSLLETRPGMELADVAVGLGLSPYGARVLMLACSAAKLVTRTEQGGYANSALASRVLLRDSPYSMVDFVRFNHEVQRRCSLHLTAALKQGRNAGLDEFPGSGDTLYSRLATYPDVEQLFQRAMGAYTRLSPRMMHLRSFEEVRLLLDVGGGDGSNAIRLCTQYPALRVTVVDIPTVVAIAGRNVAQHGLGGRITCRALDMFTDPWPDGHDAVLLSHVVEIFAPAQIASLYRSACRSLPPGGRLFVWTLMANDDETGGLQAAKSSIYFLSTASGHGLAYPGRDHQAWLEAAGFSPVTRYDAREIDHGALEAVKPRLETA